MSSISSDAGFNAASFDRLGGLFAGSEGPEPAVSAPAEEQAGTEQVQPSPEPEAPFVRARLPV